MKQKDKDLSRLFSNCPQKVGEGKRAVAFAGAERTALTEEAGGGAQPFGGKGRKRKDD